jgi:hypothetical protein
LDSCALRVLIVNDGDPLAIHLVIFLVIDPCSIEDIRADQHVLHEHIGIHHLEEEGVRRAGRGERRGKGGDLDLDEPLAEDLLVHVAEVEDEELVVDAAEASGLHGGVLSLVKGFDVNDRIGGFVEIFRGKFPALDDVDLDLKRGGGSGRSGRRQREQGHLVIAILNFDLSELLLQSRLSLRAVREQAREQAGGGTSSFSFCSLAASSAEMLVSISPGS